MKVYIETQKTRLALRRGKVVLQIQRVWMGITYWSTLKTYKTREEFTQSYLN